MSVDTRDKRASAVHVSLPWRTALPLPDGTVDAADRPIVVHMYSGISAGGGGGGGDVDRYVGFHRNNGKLMNR